MTDRQIAVVGGGIVGASVAYHLSERGERPVTVYDKGSLASETTFKSAAGYRIIGKPQEKELKRYGMRLYNDFYDGRRANGRFNLIGRLQIASTPAEASTMQTLAADTPFAEYLEAARLKEECFLPELQAGPLEGALYFPNAGRFRPRELAFEFIERARDNGVEFREGREITDLTVADGSVVGIETDKGDVPVSTVVSAAGPWNNQVADMVDIDLPLHQTLAPVLKLRPDPGLSHTIPNVLHMETGFYTAGLQDGSVLVSQGRDYEEGSDRIPPDVGTVSESFKDDAFDFIETYLPVLRDASIEDRWVGLKSRTPDEMPILGATAVRNFYLAALHVQGIQMAPASGDIIARQLLEGEPTEFYDHVSITRFDGHDDVLTTPGRA